MRLEEYLQADLIQPMDPLAYAAAGHAEPAPQPEAAGTMEEFVRRMLEGMGYEVRATRRSPFDALSTQGPDTVLTGMGADSPHLRKRARIVHSVSKVTQRPGFFVVERTTKTELDGLPVVSRTELRRLADPQAILDLILERQRLS